MASEAEKPTKLLTINDVAERLNISPRQARRLIKKRLLPHHRIGRSIRISQDDLERFVASTRKN